MKPLLRSLTILLLFTTFPHAALAKPSIDDYAAIPAVSMMRISPNGKLIAYRKQDAKQDLVVVYSLEAKKVLKAMDLNGKYPVALYFINDQHLILKGEKNQRIGGYRGFHEVSTAYVFDIASGKARQLLYPGKGVHKGQLGLGNIVGLSADGKHAFMPAFVGASEDDPNPNYSLVKTPLAISRSPDIVMRGSPYSRDYFINREGEVLAEERFNDLRNYHQILALQNTTPDEQFKEIYRRDDELRHLAPVGIYPDQQALLVSAVSEASGYWSYFKMPLNGGELSEKIFGRNDADVDEALTDINRVVYGVKYSGFYPSYEFLDSSMNQRMKEIAAQFPEQAVELSDWSPDWKNLIIHVEGSNAAGDFYLVSESNSIQFLASARPQIKVEDINPIALFKYSAADGLSIPTLITIPRDKLESMQNLPAVMLPHGGPRSYDRVSFDWLAQALASEGYLVIQPQFRGSTGFGLEHRNKGDGEWGKKMQSDLSDGLATLVKKKLVDPNRVCIVGASYGGYAALAAGAFSPAEYKCVVSINGVSDLPMMLTQVKAQAGRYHWALDYWRQVMTNDNQDRQAFKDISPANFAAQFVSPVLLLHGSEDKTVLIEQSKRMASNLEKAKKQVLFKKLKGEDHYLSGQETRKEALTEIIRFVNQNI